ncbi:SixA phosphatase family protein [Lysobacter auxotrophicus]|uniref:Histidine phosphatase family protein n=1 Tax=Lysobacter auxotrophicus TaxID=2992573 RepID=A0ABN6UMZ0_9GAMM|nr:phosphoglycerate mutase family protein [Lysobacter auxotrophicus]BDU17307.1 histidine phosphatase family protein [Lysobacter auxotrophicus]
MKTMPLTALLLSLLVSSCASAPRPDVSDTSAATATSMTFVIVRHAEKVPDGSKDPPLTEAGLARAQALAQRLSSLPVIAVYTTPFQRTRQTATPTAQEHGLPLIEYDAKLPAPEFATQLKQRHAGQTVLVVGHSNTVPDIAAALCSCEVTPMSEAEYDRLMTVRVAGDGKATLQVDRQR